MTQDAWAKFQEDVLHLIGMKPIKVLRERTGQDDSLVLFEKEPYQNAPDLAVPQGRKLLLKIKKPLVRSQDEINEVELILGDEQDYIEVPIADFDDAGIIEGASRA